MIRFFKSPDRLFYCVSYAVFALPLILFYTFFIPPFQVPDESSHFARAYQITHGEFFPTKQLAPEVPGGYIVGGTTDPGIFSAAAQLIYLQGNSAMKFTPEKAARINAFEWQQGEMRDTRNVSVYAPTFYVVPALGILLGQSFDMSIVESLKLSRLISGLSALLLVCVAMLNLRRGHGVFFVMLLMPMTLAQMASSSQDSICFAAAALCVAFLSQLCPELPQRKRRLYMFLSVVLLATIASARPPYIALSLFYLYFAYMFRNQTCFAVECCLAFVAALLATIVWSLYVALYVSVPFGLEGTNYLQQALFVLRSPLDWLAILAETWHQRWDFFYCSYIGVIGHLDTAFPNLYYHLTFLTLCLAFFMSFLVGNDAFFRGLREQALVPCAIVVATIAGTFLVLYITWSPLHYPIVEGVQGRYLIPATLFLALGASISPLTGFSEVVYRCIMIAFAAGTLFMTPYVVMVRYY